MYRIPKNPVSTRVTRFAKTEENVLLFYIICLSHILRYELFFSKQTIPDTILGYLSFRDV